MMQLAKKMSEKSKSTYKLGCVIVYKNKVIGRGFNDMDKTHPKVFSISRTIHAENAAIFNSKLITALPLKGAVAYVYREFKDGTLANAKPCKSCQEHLQQAGVEKVYYTDDNGVKELILC